MNTTHHDRRVEHYRVAANRSFSRGFAVGFLACAILVAAFMYGQRNAYGSERPAPRHALRATTLTAEWPPHTSTFLRIAACEQPKPGISWRDLKTNKQRLNAIAWHQTYNYTFPGGTGMTRVLWTNFRRASQRNIATADKASALEQVWAMYRFWKWADKTYPGHGHTGWDCHRMIGWYGFNADGSWR